MCRNKQGIGKKLPSQVVGICICLVLAVLVVFGQTAGFGFVNYDDHVYVYENPVVQQGLTWPGFLWALRYGEIGHWHPLTWLTHMADCQAYGLWAGGHHLTNVALHAATTVLLFLVLRSMTGALWRSAFVATVFAVHPLRAESVAWISERKDVLAGLFFMLTLWAYARYARQPSRGRYAALLMLYGLGLLCKNMLVTLPFVLLLLDCWPLRRFGLTFWGRVKEKVPLFVLSLGSIVATALVPEKVEGLGRVPFLVRLGNAVISYVEYLRQTIFPEKLAIPYLFPAGGIPGWHIGLALAVLVGITVVALLCWRQRPYLLIGWLWYLGMLVPAIGIVQISYYARADRYTYLPGIGLAIALTWWVADWSASWPRRKIISGSLMSLVVGALMMAGHAQTSYWHDSELLWTHTLACAPDNCVACNCLGTALAAKGSNEAAIGQYRRALAIKPDYAEARNNLGIALFKKGAREEAITQYTQALAVTPDFADAHNNLGVALFDRGDTEAAIAHYRNALAIKSDYADAHNNLGVALLTKNDLGGASAQFRAVLAINPHDTKARRGLGRTLLRQGDLPGAMIFLETTINSDPAAQWIKCGDAFLTEGSLNEAIICYRQATTIDPRSIEASESLGLAFFQKGDLKEAIHFWQQTLELKPDKTSVQNNLAWLLATTSDTSLRDGAKAVSLAERARQLSGGTNPIVLQTLAAAYAETGRYTDATATARQALALAAAKRNNHLTNKLQQAIQLYQAGQPLRNLPN